MVGSSVVTDRAVVDVLAEAGEAALREHFTHLPTSDGGASTCVVVGALGCRGGFGSII